jgi:vacuolar-type H+-ATPase subunit I/STV1
MSTANEQIYQLKRMGFSNEEISKDLRYDKEIVDVVAPDSPSASQGDAAIKVLEELMHYGENERVRADAAKFIVDKQYDKEKSKATMEFSQFTDRLQKAQDRINELRVMEG